MAGTRRNLTSDVEAYFMDMLRIRALGGAAGELSHYPMLNNLLNAGDRSLRLKMFFVSELAQRRAGHTDLGR